MLTVVVIMVQLVAMHFVVLVIQLAVVRFVVSEVECVVQVVVAIIQMIPAMRTVIFRSSQRSDG